MVPISRVREPNGNITIDEKLAEEMNVIIYVLLSYNTNF